MSGIYLRNEIFAEIWNIDWYVTGLNSARCNVDISERLDVFDVFLQETHINYRRNSFGILLLRKI